VTDEIKVEISPEFLEQLERASPEMKAKAIEMVANLRQAVQSVNEGRYDTVEDALAAITGQRPALIDTDDDDVCVFRKPLDDE
jgi:hypothetical protein